MSDQKLEAYVEKVIELLPDPSLFPKDEHGCVKLGKGIVDEIHQYYWNEKTPADCVEAMFSLEGYYTLKDIAHITEDTSKRGGYGFILDDKGVFHHLIYQYNHGVILAHLYPRECREFGLDLQRKYRDQGYFSVYDYQAFEIQKSGDFPVIRMCFGFSGDFLSFRRDYVPTEAQYKALKAWITANDMLDFKFTCSGILDTTGRGVLQALDKRIQNKKMGAPVVSELDPPEDLVLNDPEDSDNEF